jgi:hypothetical protein
MLTTAQGYTNRLCRSFRGASRLMMRERRLRSAIPRSRSEVFTLQYIQIYYRGATHIFGDFVSTDTSQAGARRSPTRKARWHWWKQYKFLLRQAIIYGNWFVRAEQSYLLIRKPPADFFSYLSICLQSPEKPVCKSRQVFSYVAVVNP